MPTYEVADEDLVETVGRVMRANHKDLADAGVTVDVLLAHGSESKSGGRGPAVKVHGRVCAAKVRITALDERVAGRKDAELVLDGDRWENWSHRTQEAVIDHELTHLWMDLSKGEDDAGRPRLKLLLHDHDYGWFDAVVKRYGAASIEVQQFVAFRDGPLNQLWLPYFEPDPDVGGRKNRRRGKDAAVKD